MKFSSLNNLGRWFNNLKYKIVNFDIKPATPIIPKLWEEIKQAEQAEDIAKIEANLRKILARNNTNFYALKRLAEIYLASGRKREAISLLKHAIRHYPESFEFHKSLGEVHNFHNHNRAACKAFARALSINPNSKDIQHLLDALRNNHTKIAPQQYIIKIFNAYAAKFENHLTGRLRYQAHIKIAAYLQEIMRRHTPLIKDLENVLDLGCGTGLLGQELLKHFQINNLEGVDLAPQMLQQSAAKQIYSKLHEMDLVQFLSQSDSEYNVIASTDVFIYIGDLEPVFEQCQRRLKPGGYFVFSLEALWCGTYKLRRTGRYQHSLRYIKSLLKKYGFSKIYTKSADLRKERNMLVPGHLVILQK